MSTWQTLPLGSRVVNLDRKRVPIKSADRKAGPYPYYGASGVVDHVDGYLFEGLHLLVAEDGENLRSRKTPIAFLADGKFWVNNHAHVLVGNDENDTRFLSYALEATDVSGYLSGSTQPKLTRRALDAIPIRAPELAVQQVISRLLGTLDEKVESNRRIAATALTLLDTFAAQAGESLDRVNLGTIALVPRAVAKPDVLGDVHVDHYSLPAFDSNACPERVPANSILSNKIALTTTSILISRLNPRTNRTWWATPVDGVPALASTEFTCLTAATEEDLAALWLAVRDSGFVEELKRRVTGTSGSHQRVRPDDLLSIEVPDITGLSTAVKQQALTILQLVQQSREESARLTALRDVLIPGLLSGEVNIAEGVEELQEAVA